MKQDKFIELLNLYLDHEISQEDAARLEEEILRNPERRKLYRQYCQMQKGCALIAEQFTDVDQPVPFEVGKTATKSRGYAGWYAGAGALAAACLAVVLVVQSNQPSVSAENAPVATSTPTPTVTVATVAPSRENNSRLAMPVFAENNTKLQTVFTPKLINTPETAERTAESAQAFFARETDAGFDWMERVQLDPLDSSDLDFRVEPAREQRPRTYRSRRAFEGQIEMTAFQFQR